MALSTVGSLQWKLGLDRSSLTAGLSKAKEDVAAFKGKINSEFNAAGNSSRNLSNEVRNTGTSFKKLLLGSAVATAAVLSLRAAFGSSVRAAFDQVKAVENATFALRAYERDGNKVNKVLKDLVSFARSDMGVLFQREELFQAAQRLKMMGVSTGNLTAGVKIMAKAVSMGVVNWEELADILNGVNAEGFLSTIRFRQLQRAGIALDASLIGTKMSAGQLLDIMDKMLPAGLLQGRANTIDGVLVRLKSSLRDLGSTILGVDSETSRFIEGGLGDRFVDAMRTLRDVLADPTIKSSIAIITSGLTSLASVIGSILAPAFSWIAANKQIIASALIGIGSAFLAAKVGALVFAAALKGVAVTSALVTAFLNPLNILLLAIGGLAGAVVYNAMGKLEDQMQKTNKETKDFGNTLKDQVPTGAKESTDAMSKLGDQLRKIDDQIKKANRDFKENLADIIRTSQQKVRDLKKQIAEEEDAYNTSESEKTREYRLNQRIQAGEHQNKVRKIQLQIDRLLRLGQAANKQELADLQYSLNQENEEYTLQQKKREQDRKQEQKREEKAHNKKLSEYLKSLNKERKFLKKHEDVVRMVRKVAMLDEIQKIKRSHREQIRAFAEQKRAAIRSAQQATQGVKDQWDGLSKKMQKNTGGMKKAGKLFGKAMGNAMKDALKQALKDVGRGISNWMGEFGQKVLRNIPGPLGGAFKQWERSQNEARAWANAPIQGFRHRAMGGPVEKGKPYFVGEKGVEAFFPKQDGLVVPNNALPRVNKTGGAPAQSVTNYHYHLSGIMTDSRTGVRRVAKQLIQAHNEMLTTKGKATIPA